MRPTVIIEEMDASVAEPVGLADLRRQLNAELVEDEPLATRLITTARETVERATGRLLSPRTLRATVPAIARDSTVRLARAPVAALLSAEADTGGATIDLAPDDFRLRLGMGGYTLAPRTGRGWPALDADGELRLYLAAGPGPGESPPAALTTAVLRLAAHWYTNRESVVLGMGGAAVLPLDVDSLLRPLRLRMLG